MGGLAAGLFTLASPAAAFVTVYFIFSQLPWPCLFWFHITPAVADRTEWVKGRREGVVRRSLNFEGKGDGGGSIEKD